MIRTLSLIKRRADHDRAAFRVHYESTHAPLALPFMRGLLRYVRYHVMEDLIGAFDFDVLTAFWYEDAKATAKMMEALASEAARPLLEDELTFMDQPANRFFQVSERQLIRDEGAEEGEDAEGDEHVFVLMKKPDEVSRYDASRQIGEFLAPELLATCAEPSFALLRDAFAVEGVEGRGGAKPYDAVLQIRAAGYEGLGYWSEAMSSKGYGVAAVRTERFETELEGD